MTDERRLVHLALIDERLESMKPTRATRNRRARHVRGRTLNTQRMPERELRAGAAEVASVGEYTRPATRGDCEDEERPCPFVGCPYHLFLDVNADNGSIKFNFPDLEPDQLPISCALDVADRGGSTLEEIGALLNVTRERIRQIEVRAARAFKRAGLRLVSP